MRPVDHVVEQLWAPALESPDLRVQPDPAVGDDHHDDHDDGWTTVEDYWLLPRAASARLLVPRGPRAVTRASLVNYRRLRTTRVNAVRLALGTLARAGVPISRDRLTVQVRRSGAEAAERLPLALIGAALGRRLYAATGVRTSDNRKTTLHLLEPSGRPAGYAKIGWTAATDGFVATEARTLRAVGGRPGPTRAPGLLAELAYGGHAVAVTEPLPLDVRAGSAVPAPSAEEMYALTPVVRRDRPGRTRQLAAMAERLDAARGRAVVTDLADDALDLLRRVADVGLDLPVTERWHGDLTPWNYARDASGQLWLWDWESSEPDALAGLDPLHWAFGRRRLTVAAVGDIRLVDCLADAADYLTAAGVPADGCGALAAAYAVSVVERACTLAAASGDWSDAYIQPAGLAALLGQGRALLG